MLFRKMKVHGSHRRVTKEVQKKRADKHMPKTLYVAIMHDGYYDAIVQKDEMQEGELYGVYELQSISRVSIDVKLLP